MADFTFPSSSLSENPVVSVAASSSAGPVVDDSFEDACSICLDPFTAQDPATVTSCRHEYHLHCILEWSQRSKECPTCWQLFVLKEPASQELLAAVETERHLRSRNISPAAFTNLSHYVEDFDVEQDSSSDDSDFDEHIMQHFSAAAAGRAHYFHRRRESEGSSGLGPSQVLVFNSLADASSVQQTHSARESQNLNGGSSGGSPTSARPSVVMSSTDGNRDGPTKPRILCSRPTTDTPQGPGSAEMPSLSNSIKSKWFAASARYKESISKSTRGMKEKLLARNNTVKELSKGVQRDISAGIAGVARMIERLDLNKRSGVSSPVSGFTGGSSNFSLKGKDIQENLIAETPDNRNEEIDLDANSHASSTLPGQMEVPHLQRGH